MSNQKTGFISIKFDPVESLVQKPISAFYGTMFNVFIALLVVFAFLPYTEGLETVVSASFLTAGFAIPVMYERMKRVGTKTQAVIVSGAFGVVWVFNLVALMLLVWG